MQLTADNIISTSFKTDANGLFPAIVQHAFSGQVLMQGYMNTEALAQTFKNEKVTFFSRSKNRLWVKGESSENYLLFKAAWLDCDKDAVLVKAIPAGPVCHTGTTTCFDEKDFQGLLFLNNLEEIIADRKDNPSETSYTSSLFKKGINKVAQKVGEEAVELVIEAKDNNEGLFLNEAADLMYHYLVLLKEKGYQLADVLEVLKSRNH